MWLEMSGYTGRLHLHGRRDGTRPLGSIRPEALGPLTGEHLGIEEAAEREIPPEAAAWVGEGGAGALVRLARQALLEWHNLNSGEQRALRGLCFRPPLRAAAQAAKPPPAKGSTRRYTPGHQWQGNSPLPPGGRWRLVNVTLEGSERDGGGGGHGSGGRWWVRWQFSDAGGRRVCVVCARALMHTTSLAPPTSPPVERAQLWAGGARGGTALPSAVTWRHVTSGSHVTGEAARLRTFVPWDGREVLPVVAQHELFCGGRCWATYKQRTSPGALRHQLAKEEAGVCQECGLDAKLLTSLLKASPPESRLELLIEKHPPFALPRHLTRARRLAEQAREGAAWHADHIVPVFGGGGECGLDNLRTLCVLCHADTTARQAAERAELRRKASRLALQARAPKQPRAPSVALAKRKRVRRKTGPRAASEVCQTSASGRGSEREGE